MSLPAICRGRVFRPLGPELVEAQILGLFVLEEVKSGWSLDFPILRKSSLAGAKHKENYLFPLRGATLTQKRCFRQGPIAQKSGHNRQDL